MLSIKLIYVASPVRGDIEENLKRANRYCEYVAMCGHIPIAPHLAWQGFLQDDIPEKREQAIKLGLALLEHCSEMWVCGDEISNGMLGEIAVAEKLHIPTLYILDQRIEENMKIRQEQKPLEIEDCIPNSNTQDYENKILVLDPNVLIKSCRNAQNSLWVAYNGFGCTYGARGQAVHAKNLFDGREAHWERADFLGIVSKESLIKWLVNSPVKNEVANSVAFEQEQSEGLER